MLNPFRGGVRRDRSPGPSRRRELGREPGDSSSRPSAQAQRAAGLREPRV